LDWRDDDDDFLASNQSRSDTECNYDVTEEHWDINSEDILKEFDQEVCSEDFAQTKYHHCNIVFDVHTAVGNILWESAAALNHLIKFLHWVLSLLASASPSIAALLAVFPTLLQKIQQ